MANEIICLPALPVRRSTCRLEEHGHGRPPPLSLRVVMHAALMLLQASREYIQRRRMNGQARRMNTDAADQHQPEDAANKLTDA